MPALLSCLSVRLQIAKSVPRGASLWRVAFLHEGGDPGRGVPAPLADSIRDAARRSGFRGKDRETAATAGRDGALLLVGLGRAPSSLARLRRALRRAVQESASRSRSRLLLVFGAGTSEATLRAMLPHLALADYAFERYKSAPKKGRTRGEARGIAMSQSNL